MTKREIIAAAKKRAALCDNKEQGAAFVRQVERDQVSESRAKQRFAEYQKERKNAR